MKLLRSLGALAMLVVGGVSAQAQSVAIRVNPANFQFVLPFQNSATYDPLNDKATPVDLGKVSWINQATTPNCAISGPQSVGFTIDPATCLLTLRYDYKSLDAGALNQWGKLRNFNVTASQSGGGTLTGTIQVTFDTSAFLARGNPVAGLDTIIGVTDKSPYKVIDKNNMPDGWTYAIGTTAGGSDLTPAIYIYPNKNNPTPLIHYDLRGLVVYGYSSCVYRGFTGIKIRQSIFGPTPTFSPAGRNSWFSFYCGLVTDTELTNDNFDLQGDTYQISGPAVNATVANFSNNVMAGCAVDCLNGTINGTNNYIRTAAGGGNRVWEQGNPKPQTLVANQNGATQWDHADGYQSISTSRSTSLTYSYIDARYYGFDYSKATYRLPSGSISCSGTSCTGTGTSWATGADKDRIYSSDSIIPGHVLDHFQVASVTDDTHLTLQGTGGTFTQVSQKYQVGPQSAVLTQVSFPLYAQGISPATPNASLFSFNVLRGGGATIHGSGTNLQGLLSHDNNVMGDWSVQAQNGSVPNQMRTQNNVWFKDLTTPVGTFQNPALRQPIIALGTVTATAAALTFDDQGGGTVYRFRSKPLGGAWSAWATATPGGTNVTGLSASTNYSVEIQAQNAPLDDGTEYIQSSQSLVSFTTPAS